MKKEYKLPRSIVRACSGILEGVKKEPYIQYIAEVEKEIGTKLYEGNEKRRENFVKAIELNIINNRENTFDMLDRKYELSVSLATFKRHKYKFCWLLAKKCGFI